MFGRMMKNYQNYRTFWSLMDGMSILKLATEIYVNATNTLIVFIGHIFWKNKQQLIKYEWVVFLSAWFSCTQVAVAASFGCVGVLLYGDPKDYAPGPKFPKGRWLPDDGVQRGSVIGYGDDVTEGDPMTRNYPAKSKFFFQPILF